MMPKYDTGQINDTLMIDIALRIVFMLLYINNHKI